jgi:hypothetical protein
MNKECIEGVQKKEIKKNGLKNQTDIRIKQNAMYGI